MTTDILTNYDEEFYDGPFCWHSTFTTAINDMTCTVLAKAMDCNAIPDYAFEKATLP